MINGFDNESKRWTHVVHVLVHDLFHDCGLARVVQPAENIQLRLAPGSHLPTASISSSPYPSVVLSSGSTAFIHYRRHVCVT